MLAGLSVQKPCGVDIMWPNLTGNILYHHENKAMHLVWLLDFDVFSG